jgi:hypothetical protein
MTTAPEKTGGTAKRFTDDDSRWQAVLGRELAADGELNS